MFIFAFHIFILFHSNSAHTPEKYLKYRFHIIHQHLLEILLLFIKLRVLLLLPHFIYDTLINVPVPHMG